MSRTSARPMNDVRPAAVMPGVCRSVPGEEASGAGPVPSTYRCRHGGARARGGAGGGRSSARWSPCSSRCPPWSGRCRRPTPTVLRRRPAGRRPRQRGRRVLRVRRVGRRARAAGDRPAHLASPTCSATGPTMRVWWRGADRQPGRRRHRRRRDRHATATPAAPGPGSTSARPGHPHRRRRRSRCPPPPDLLPTTLGRRLLSEADRRRADPDRRPSGSPAATPWACGWCRPSAASSVGRVDVWVDADSGLPLQVQVYAQGRRPPALDTRFLDLDVGRRRRRTSPPSRRRPARIRAGAATAEIVLRAPAAGSDPVAAARTSWPGCRAARSTARRRPSACTAAGSPCSPSCRCPAGSAGDLRRRRWRRTRTPSATTLGTRLAAGPLGHHAGRAAGAGPVRARPARSPSTRWPQAAARAAGLGGTSRERR